MPIPSISGSRRRPVSAAGAHVLQLLERQQGRADEADEQDQAEGVEGPALRPAWPRLQAQRQQQGEGAERHVDQEDRAPAELMRQVAADDRPESARGDHHRRQITLVARALARRDGLADQRLGQGHQATAAEALQHASERQHLHAACAGTQQRGGDKHAEGDQHHAPATVYVAQLAVDRRGDGGGHQVR